MCYAGGEAIEGMHFFSLKDSLFEHFSSSRVVNLNYDHIFNSGQRIAGHHVEFIQFLIVVFDAVQSDSFGIFQCTLDLSAIAFEHGK